jgi:hypothetical protein
MSDPPHSRQVVKAGWAKYLWPTPMVVILYIGVLAVIIHGRKLFFATHVFFEIGIMVSLVASVCYAIRLRGKSNPLAPRWVFFLNLAPCVFLIVAATINTVVAAFK